MRTSRDFFQRCQIGALFLLVPVLGVTSSPTWNLTKDARTDNLNQDYEQPSSTPKQRWDGGDGQFSPVHASNGNYGNGNPPAYNAPSEASLERPVGTVRPPVINTPSSSFVEKPTRNLTIAITGRSGSGVSSTIRQLIGAKTKCVKPSYNETLRTITEYSILDLPSNSGGFNLRLVDVPGWVDGRTPEQDAEILASIKSYVETFGAPDFYLSLTRFDDSRIDGIHSLFVQSLKRLELLHEVFLNNTDFTREQSSGNILFLLTRLMSETKTNQRKPDKKIQVFQGIIEEFTNFRSPLKVTVGENKAVTEYELPEENGYAKLPNKELYPKNIWEGLKTLTNDKVLIDSLDSIIRNRETEFNCKVDVVNANDNNADDDTTAFYYLLDLKDKIVLGNEVNRKIDAVYENATKETKLTDVVQKIALQLRLQEQNFTSIASLPTNHADRAAFFQNNNLFSGPTPAFYFDKAFSLEMPEYILSLTIGKGYDVTTDDITTSLPFKGLLNVPNSIGYSLPSFMRCRKLIAPDIQLYKSHSENLTEYIEERFKYLDFPEKSTVNKTSFNVMVKEGFNLKPEVGSSVVSLSAVQEYRTISCKLVEPEQWSLSPDFIDEVYALVSFNKHDKDSVTEWKSFFSKWGTHVVSRSFGGGSVIGSLVGSSSLYSEGTLDDTLNSIVRYSPFSAENMGVPKYRVFGGEPDPRSENMYTMENRARKELLSRWEKSLNSNFIMLMNEFGLIAISDVIREKIGYERAAVVRNALDTLLKGELVFVRKRSQSSGNSQSGPRTPRPVSSSQPTGRPQHVRPTQPSDHLVTDAPSILTEQPTHFVSPSSQSVALGNGQSDIIQQAVQSHQERMNLQIRDLEREIAARQHKSDADLAAAEAELERLKSERKQRAEQRQKEMKASLQRVAQNNREFYQRQTAQLEEEMKQATEAERRRQEMLTLQQRESDRQHDLMMARLAEQFAQEEEMYREQSRCSGVFSWIECQARGFGEKLGIVSATTSRPRNQKKYTYPSTTTTRWESQRYVPQSVGLGEGPTRALGATQDNEGYRRDSFTPLSYNGNMPRPVTVEHANTGHERWWEYPGSTQTPPINQRQSHPETHSQSYSQAQSQSYPETHSQSYSQAQSQSYPETHSQSYSQAQSQSYPETHSQSFQHSQSQYYQRIQRQSYQHTQK